MVGLDRKRKPSAICDYYIESNLNDLNIESFQDIPPIDAVYHLAALVQIGEFRTGIFC